MNANLQQFVAGEGGNGGEGGEKRKEENLRAKE